jgi:tRNA wybutosine-synthesizing protein 1
MVTSELISKYKKSGYRVLGKHSAVEICRWNKSVLRGKRNCYKRWFDIQSHRCIQMTPSIMCNFACQFCWRRHAKPKFENRWDTPEFIIDWMIETQKKLLSGFGGNTNTTKELFKEALQPKHVAISLDGEPTLYPYLADLIKEIKNRNMTVFLVTNGTMPNRLKELIKNKSEPTNLYISVYGTNEQDYKKTCKPIIPDAFELVKESLNLMKEFKEARTIFRITAVKNLTLLNPESYSELIKMSEPQFVEIKGYAWLGESRQRLTENAVPTIEEIREFSKKLERLTGYTTVNEDEASRVVLMKSYMPTKN